MNGVEPLDDLYFEWLHKFLGPVSNRNPARGYWTLAKTLYTTEFVYFIPNDDNRAEDGKYLREEFLDDAEVNPEAYEYFDDWMDLPCSFFEMLVALAQRADFQADMEVMEEGVDGWVHLFLHNLLLDTFTDAFCKRGHKRSLEEIRLIIEKVNNRTYAKDGTGGLFPLPGTHKDMRKKELWYQLDEYLRVNGYVQV